MTIPYEPRRFQSTAVYYLDHRVPYPDTLIDRIAERTGLKAGDRVLDLGCGPAQLGIAFARRGARITAMDPEPEMLEAARVNAAAAGVEITLRQGSSYDLDAGFGPFKLVTMGRSFHWMDRPATLAALDTLIELGGAVVLFDDRNIAARPNWRAVVEQLAEKFSPERDADRKRRKGGDWEPHESMLLNSAFSDLERIGILRRRTLTIDAIVGRAFSTSVTSPQALGARKEEFEAALRQELLRLSPEGMFMETVEASGLMAFRPG